MAAGGRPWIGQPDADEDVSRVDGLLMVEQFCRQTRMIRVEMLALFSCLAMALPAL